MRLKIPRDGDEKIKRKFAFLPVITDKEIRWLEFVTVKYVYSNYCGFWLAEEFIDETSN